MPQRLYGSNRVYCKGRFITGPDGRSSFFTFMMVLVPSILWQIFTCPYFTQRYTAVFPIFGTILQLGSVVLLFKTALSDPGIMPRQKDFTDQYDPRTKAYRVKQPVRYYDLVLRGHPFKVKYCTTCNIYRPPRCTHCSVCDSCVERFDHHCPWVGNCIGKRNYKYFYAFITCTGALNVFVLVTSVLHVSLTGLALQSDSEGALSGGGALVQAMGKEPLSTALAIYNTLVVWFTVGLCAYHTYLIATNQTTYEQIKGVYSNGANPFHRGVSGNCGDILCSRVRTRYFDAYTEELRWPKAGALQTDDGKVAESGPSSDSCAEENETDGHGCAKSRE